MTRFCPLGSLPIAKSSAFPVQWSTHFTALLLWTSPVQRSKLDSDTKIFYLVCNRDGASQNQIKSSIGGFIISWWSRGVVHPTILPWTWTVGVSCWAGSKAPPGYNESTYTTIKTMRGRGRYVNAQAFSFKMMTERMTIWMLHILLWDNPIKISEA